MIKTPKKKSGETKTPNANTPETKSPNANTPQSKKKKVNQSTDDANQQSPSTPKAKNAKENSPAQGKKKSQTGNKRGRANKLADKNIIMPQLPIRLSVVKLHLPKLRATKPALEKILPHCEDVKIMAHNILSLKLAEVNAKDELAALQLLTFEGKKLRVIVHEPPRMHPLKRLMKFPKFGVDLKNLKEHFSASSVQQLHTVGDPKSYYVLNFESEEAANEAMKKPKFTFLGKEYTPTKYLVFPANASKNMTESNEGFVTKKMKTSSGAKSTKKSPSAVAEK